MPDPVLTDPQTSEIAEVVLVANTAAYLVRRLRETSVVQFLSQKHSAQELIAFAQRVVADQKERFSLSAAAQAYAAMVAATMRPGTEFSEALREQGTPNIRWGADVARQSQSSPSVSVQAILATSASPVHLMSTAPSGRPIGKLIEMGN